MLLFIKCFLNSQDVTKIFTFVENDVIYNIDPNTHYVYILPSLY